MSIVPPFGYLQCLAWIRLYEAIREILDDGRARVMDRGIVGNIVVCPCLNNRIPCL